MGKSPLQPAAELPDWAQYRPIGLLLKLFWGPKISAEEEKKIYAQTTKSTVHLFYDLFSRRGLDAIELAYNPCQPDGRCAQIDSSSVFENLYSLHMVVHTTKIVMEQKPNEKNTMATQCQYKRTYMYTTARSRSQRNKVFDRLQTVCQLSWSQGQLLHRTRRFFYSGYWNNRRCSLHLPAEGQPLARLSWSEWPR